MKFVPVVSSQISQLGHDAVSSTMRVVFTNGSTYEYANVSRELFEELLAAPSVGSHFSKVIKKNHGTYPFTKIGA